MARRAVDDVPNRVLAVVAVAFQSGDAPRGLTIRDIAERAGIAKGTAQRWATRLVAEGRLKARAGYTPLPGRSAALYAPSDSLAVVEGRYALPPGFTSQRGHRPGRGDVLCAMIEAALDPECRTEEMTVARVAREAGCCETTARHWLRELAGEGAVVSRPALRTPGRSSAWITPRLFFLTAGAMRYLVGRLRARAAEVGESCRNGHERCSDRNGGRCLPELREALRKMEEAA